MIKENLFILRSPIQIINAIEAIEKFDLKNNILVLIFNSLDKNTNQINKLVKLYRWKKIIKLENKSRSKLFRYVKLVNELKKSKYNYLFFGNLGTIQKVLIANLKVDNIYLLDDGTSTITYYNNFIKKSKVNKYNFRELRFLFFGLKFKIKSEINLFTYFDLEVKSNIKIVKNELTLLNNKDMLNFKHSNEIYFIGQPLDDVEVLSIDNYIKVLVAISKKFNRKIIYIPHRAESNELKDAISKIDEQLIMVLNVNMPVELYFIENKIYPNKVISFFSTALNTMKAIYNKVDINVVKIPYKEVNNKKYYKEFLEDYYSKVEENNFIKFYNLGL